MPLSTKENVLSVKILQYGIIRNNDFAVSGGLACIDTKQQRGYNASLKILK
jgi:hypothetical protein